MKADLIYTMISRIALAIILACGWVIFYDWANANTVEATRETLTYYQDKNTNMTPNVLVLNKIEKALNVQGP